MLKTSDCNPVLAVFTPEVVGDGQNLHVLSPSEIVRFDQLFLADRRGIPAIQAEERRMRRKAERRADGLSDACSRWMSFSAKSTQIPRLPGEFFPSVVDMCAKVPYDLSTIGQLGTLDDGKEDRKSIFRRDSTYAV